MLLSIETYDKKGVFGPGECLASSKGSSEAQSWPGHDTALRHVRLNVRYITLRIKGKTTID